MATACSPQSASLKCSASRMESDKRSKPPPVVQESLTASIPVHDRCSPRSVLFSTSRCWAVVAGSTPSGGRGLLASAISSNKSAASICLTVLWIPSTSIWSSDSRIPAVSTSRSGIPRRLMISSIVSRVVPAMSLTMARSKPSKRLSKLDLPTFGSPKITVRTPSRRTRPWSAVASRESTTERTELIRPRSSAPVCGSMSSSGKSIHASRWARVSSSWSRAAVVRFPRVPSSWLRAARSESRVCAEIRSMTPSACVRSSFPLRNAR